MNSNNQKISKKPLPSHMSDALAEVYGALIGDGCLSTYYSKSNKRQIYSVSFTGHIHDFEYYDKIIRPIFIQEFGTRGYINHRSQKRGKAIDYVINSKRIFEWFSDYGFPVGKKLNLTIPAAITIGNKLAKACIRGIFDTDGSVYRRYSKQYGKHSKIYDHIVIQFKIKSKELLEQIKKILEENRITTTKIGKVKDIHVLRITHQDSIYKFMEIIKPNSKYHMERYLNKCKSSTVVGS